MPDKRTAWKNAQPVEVKSEHGSSVEEVLIKQGMDGAPFQSMPPNDLVEQVEKVIRGKSCCNSL